MLTPYDHEHRITYLRLLDADAAGADWKEVTQIVLHIDPERERVRAWQAYESHLVRARWMTKVGYRLLLRSGWPVEQSQSGKAACAEGASPQKRWRISRRVAEASPHDSRKREIMAVFGGLQLLQRSSVESLGSQNVHAGSPLRYGLCRRAA